MKEDVAGLVERLEAWGPLVASGYEVPAASKAIHEAASTIRALVAEIERLRGCVTMTAAWERRALDAEAKLREAVGIIASQNSVIVGQAAAFSSLGDRFEAAEAKLREAVEVIYTAPITPFCDWKCGDGTSHGPCLSSCGARAWDDRRIAFLATMEKPNGQ